MVQYYHMAWFCYVLLKVILHFPYGYIMVNPLFPLPENNFGVSQYLQQLDNKCKQLVTILEKVLYKPSSSTVAGH